MNELMHATDHSTGALRTRPASRRPRGRRGGLAPSGSPRARVAIVPPAAGTDLEQGFLGVRLDPLALSDGDGAEVVQLVPGSVAAWAGLNPHDRITWLGTKDTPTNGDLVEALGLHRPGDEVDVAWSTPMGTAHVARIQLTGGPPGWRLDRSALAVRLACGGRAPR
jgi:hypothetical protein